MTNQETAFFQNNSRADAATEERLDTRQRIAGTWKKTHQKGQQTGTKEAIAIHKHKAEIELRQESYHVLQLWKERTLQVRIR